MLQSGGKNNKVFTISWSQLSWQWCYLNINSAYITHSTTFTRWLTAPSTLVAGTTFFSLIMETLALENNVFQEILVAKTLQRAHPYSTWLRQLLNTELQLCFRSSVQCSKIYRDVRSLDVHLRDGLLLLIDGEKMSEMSHLEMSHPK